MDHHK